MSFLITRISKRKVQKLIVFFHQFYFVSSFKLLFFVPCFYDFIWFTQFYAVQSMNGLKMRRLSLDTSFPT